MLQSAVQPHGCPSCPAGMCSLASGQLIGGRAPAGGSEATGTHGIAFPGELLGQGIQAF